MLPKFTLSLLGTIFLWLCGACLIEAWHGRFGVIVVAYPAAWIALALFQWAFKNKSPVKSEAHFNSYGILSFLLVAITLLISLNEKGRNNLTDGLYAASIPFFCSFIFGLNWSKITSKFKNPVEK